MVIKIKYYCVNLGIYFVEKKKYEEKYSHMDRTRVTNVFPCSSEVCPRMTFSSNYGKPRVKAKGCFSRLRRCRQGT